MSDDQPESPSRRLHAGCFYAIPALFIVSAVCGIIAVYFKFHGH